MASFLFSHNASWLLKTTASTWEEEEEEIKIFPGLIHDKDIHKISQTLMSTCQVACCRGNCCFVSSFVISTSSALYYDGAMLSLPPPTDKTNVVYLLRPVDGKTLHLLFFFFSFFYSESAEKTQRKNKQQQTEHSLKKVWILDLVITELSFNVRHVD